MIIIIMAVINGMKRVVNKLKKAGIPLSELEIGYKTIEIQCGYREIVSNNRTFGECDEAKVSEMRSKIADVLPKYKSGYYTGYGSLVLQENYVVNTQDYCDPTNPIHY